MTTIAYDRPVLDLIDELNATGHVTHKSYKKTGVTFHHNAGRLSHLGVLRVWQVRPASAQFNIDGVGSVAQYVKALEYAWATGNTEGNMRDISIEMCNESLSPEWRVSEVTWKSAARLAGWLFAKVIKARPDSSNIHFHHHWYNTSCAGPYMDSVKKDLIAEVQKWYKFFTGDSSGKVILKDDGVWGPVTQLRLEEIMAEQGYRVSIGGDPVGQMNRYFIESVQTALNKAGKRDKFGAKLAVDGRGLGYNIDVRYPRFGWTRTITAIQRGFGFSAAAADGYFDPISTTVKKIQNDANYGTDIPFYR